MVGKIVNVDQLSFDEASRIEGDWSRFSDDELAALSSSKSASSIRNELESGDIALIVDSPYSPMLSKMENGFSVSQQNAPLLSDYRVKKIGHRFSGNYYGGTVAKSGGLLHPAKPMPTYIPEPVIKTQPSIYDPIKISDNLSKPKTNKIFAKSCSQPFGNTEACQKKNLLFDPRVNKITNGEPIPFKNGRPIFTKWSRGYIHFEKGELNGTDKDFDKAYDAIAKSENLSSRNAARVFIKDREISLTIHHLSDTEVQLIPTDLHVNVPHMGSAADMRTQNND
ncbi:hypothetical protein C0W35_21365 [Photobacterium kishitanii]|uniref:HNH endonuclease n=1 Tax=Photobacterium kishitanii TaxID=318456 RepID=UPI000D151C51|nr:HNH endonuclease [Photobacterium kishitanii]PSU87552.1 hypothetical protein C0W35_21365 [Photobacterium kishitanii]